MRSRAASRTAIASRWVLVAVTEAAQGQLRVVIDDPAEVPDAAAERLELREVELPDAVASLDGRQERLAALTGKLASLAQRSGRLDEPPPPQRAQDGGLRARLESVGSQQRPDLAVSPSRPLQRELRRGLLDAVTLRRRPRPPAGLSGSSGGLAAMPRRAMNPRQRAGPADRQTRVQAHQLQLDMGNPAAPPRLASRSSTCASPKAWVSSPTCASSCASRPVGRATGLGRRQAVSPRSASGGEFLEGGDAMATSGLGSGLLAPQDAEHDPQLRLDRVLRRSGHKNSLCSAVLETARLRGASDPPRSSTNRRRTDLDAGQRELALAQRPRRTRHLARGLHEECLRETILRRPPRDPAAALDLQPLPHEHSALRPIFAIAASSHQHRSEPAPATRRTYGRLY